VAGEVEAPLKTSDKPFADGSMVRARMRNSALLRGDDATEVYCPPARSASPPDDAVGNGQLSHDRQLRHGLQRSDGAILIGIAAFLFAAAFVAFDRLGIHRNASGSEQRVQRRGHSCRVPLFLIRRDRADIRLGPTEQGRQQRDVVIRVQGVRPVGVAAPFLLATAHGAV
jgi:hypothetical protein